LPAYNAAQFTATKVLDVKGGSKKADTQIVIWSQKKDGTQSQNQLWLYHDGFIVNVHSRLVLDVRGCKTELASAMVKRFFKIL
jgi:hypothetical protein